MERGPHRDWIQLRADGDPSFRAVLGDGWLPVVSIWPTLLRPELTGPIWFYLLDPAALDTEARAEMERRLVHLGTLDPEAARRLFAGGFPIPQHEVCITLRSIDPPAPATRWGRAIRAAISPH